MDLVYVDEVKHQPPSPQYSWLGALAPPEAAIHEIEAKLASIAEEHFGTEVIEASDEFHAKCMDLTAVVTAQCST